MNPLNWEHFEIMNGLNVRDIDVISCGKHFEEIQKLKITSSLFYKVAYRCGRYLISVDLTHNTYFNGSLITALTKLCPSLQSLKVNVDIVVTPFGIQSLARNCPHIKNIEFNTFRRIDDYPQLDKCRNRSLSNLFLNNRGLKGVHLNFKINDACVRHLPYKYIQDFGYTDLNFSSPKICIPVSL